MSTPTWRLAPWRRAPLLGLLDPAAVLGVLVTTAVLACAAASAPLFLSSARSAALQQELAPQCAEAGWGQTGGSVTTPAGASPDRLAADADAFARGWRAQGLVPQPVLEVTSAVSAPGSGLTVSGSTGVLARAATVLWRPGATGQVHRLESARGSGVWLPRSYARAAGVRAGGSIGLLGRPVRVVGVYTDLPGTISGPFWCDYDGLLLTPPSAGAPPPALLLATDQATVLRIAAVGRSLTVLEQVPTPRGALTGTRARALLAAQLRAQAAAGRLQRTPEGTVVGTVAGTSDTFQPRAGDRLGTALLRAGTVAEGLRGPVVPVAVAVGLLALVLVAAAGGAWADRRAAEVRLLTARGVGPGALAGKAALELALPALAGAALGWTAARLLTAAVGPADDLDPAATHAAVLAAAAAVAGGLACAAVVAGLRAGTGTERPRGAGARWPARVPWELALLAAAAVCAVLLAGHPAVVVVRGVARVSGLLVAVLLLGTAGAAVLLGRLAVRGLPALRRAAGRRRGTAAFLAANRLAAAPAATAALLVAVALPVAVLGCTATLTASSRLTVDAKVGVEVGATRAVLTTAFLTPDPRTDATGTLVHRYRGTVASGPIVDGATRSSHGGVQLLGVDPATFARTAYWRPSFADRPLASLVAELRGPEFDHTGRLPVVAAGLPVGDADIQIGRLTYPVHVMATALVLPGRRTADPEVLVAADRLPHRGDLEGGHGVSELWTDGPEAAARAAALAAGAVAPRALDGSDALSAADVVGIGQAFGYLSALAVLAGVITVCGQLQHLAARSRARVSGYAVGRRMGLHRRGHLASLGLELGGVAVLGFVLGGLLATAAVALVHRHLDVDPLRPPTPLLAVPWPTVAAAAGVTVLVAALASGWAQVAADRADPATVLREDA